MESLASLVRKMEGARGDRGVVVTTPDAVKCVVLKVCDLLHTSCSVLADLDGVRDAAVARAHVRRDLAGRLTE